MPTETDVCNIAGGKIGGFGDALNGNAFIGSIDDTDKVSTFCKFTFPRVRRRVIVDLASRDTPFRSTIRFKDLGSEIDEDDTLEIGQWQHAFNLPKDCLVVISHFDENFIAQRSSNGNQSRPTPITYQWEEVADKDGNGKVFLTNTLSNKDRDSAFVEYSIDIPTVGAWNEQMIDCVATLLAAELCPVVGRDMESRAALTQEYYLKSIPDAQRVNQSGLNNSARGIPNFLGGRDRGLVPVRGASDLGTYKASDGSRRSI